MDSIQINADNSEQLEDCLENAWQDFNDFKEKMLELNSRRDVNLDEIVDSYISHGGVNTNGTSNKTIDQFTEPNQDFNQIIDLNTSHGQVKSYCTSNSIMDQFTTVLQDFNEVESMLPHIPHTETNINITRGLDMNKEIQDSEMMIMEMADSTGELGNFEAFGQDGNINCETVLDGRRKKVTYIRYGDMNHCGAGGGDIRSLLGGCGNVMLPAPVLGNFRVFGGRKDPDFTENGRANTSAPRHRQKRKYKGAIETEEEAAQRLERIKMNNRVSAAKAQAQKQAREAYLQEKLSKIRMKYKSLKKLIRCWEEQENINLPPEKLRRTISGPSGFWTCRSDAEHEPNF